MLQIHTFFIHFQLNFTLFPMTLTDIQDSDLGEFLYSGQFY